MHYAYKSSINEEYANDFSDYDSDEVDPYNYFECEDEDEVFKQAFLRGESGRDNSDCPYDRGSISDGSTSAACYD